MRPRYHIPPHQSGTAKRNWQTIRDGHVHDNWEQLTQTLEKKWYIRCEKGIFVGYDRNTPSYLVYYSENRKVLNHRQPKFVIDQQTQTDDDDDFLWNKYIQNQTSMKIPGLQINISNDEDSTQKRIVIFGDTPKGKGEFLNT